MGELLYNHLIQHVGHPLDSDIRALLQSARLRRRRRSSLKIPSHEDYPDPRLLLAPKILSQQENIDKLDYCAGMGSRYVAYNIQGLVFMEGGCFSKPTIEFRQHQGTLDADSAVAWI